MIRRTNRPPSPAVRCGPRKEAIELVPPPAGSVTTFFQQECPVCGRPLRILVEHLGQKVNCSHCCCEFACRDPSQNRHDGGEAHRSTLDRAERLLALLDSPSRRPPRRQSAGHRDESLRR